MKKKLKLLSRTVSILLTMLLLMQSVVIAAKPSNADEIWGKFSERSTFKGMKAWYGDNMDYPIVVAEPNGWQLSCKSKKWHIYVDVDDNLVKNLNGQAVEIEVDYFDKGAGAFTVCYDGYYNEEQDAEYVDLTNTNEWKTHRFFIQDAKFVNGLNNADFRITVGGKFLGNDVLGESVRDDIIFGGVRVRKSDIKSPIRMKIHSEKPGNVFFKDEKIKMTVDYTNAFDQALDLTARFTVVDSFNRTLSVKEEPISFKAKETRSQTYEFTQERFDICWFRVELFNEDNSIYNIKDAEFSYVTTTYGEYLNPYVASSTMMDDLAYHNSEEYGYHYKDAELVSTLFKNAGYGRDRMNYIWRYVNVSKDNWATPSRMVERMKTFKEKGIKLTIILSLAYGADYPLREGETSAFNLATPTADFDKAYEDYIRFAVRETKEYADTYILGNEPEHVATPDWQKVPEEWVHRAKIAYRVIREEYPEALIQGYGLTLGDQPWFEETIKYGANDCFDQADVHCYSVFRTFEDYDFLGRIKTYWDAAKEKYNVDMAPAWIGETGYFHIRHGGLSNYEISQQFPILYIYTFASDLVDGVTDYCFLTYRVESFGHFRGSDPAGKYGIELPYAPFREFLTISCWNNNFGADLSLIDNVKEDNLRLYRFNRARDGKQFIASWVKADTEYVTLDLGVNEIEYMDILGNSEKMYSNDGCYTFNITKDMKYIIGDFTKFEILEKPKYDWSATALSVVEGSYSDLTLTINGSDGEGYTLETSEYMLGQCDSVSSDGNKLTASLSVANRPNTMANMYLHGEPGRSQFLMYHDDDARNIVRVDVKKDGKLYATTEIPLSTTKAITVNTKMMPKSLDNLGNWESHFTLNNVSKTPLSGVFKITEPAVWAEKVKPATFSIEPGKSATVVYSIPGTLLDKDINLAYQTVLDNGKIIEFNELRSPMCAVYATNPPTIDGKIEDGEWIEDIQVHVPANSWRTLIKTEPFVGEDDCSADVSMLWDKENLYVSVKVKDDIHCMPETSARMTWKADSLQIAFTGKETSTIFTGLLIGWGDDGNMYMRRTASEDSSHPIEDLTVDALEAKALHQDGLTTYELRIPWDTIMPATEVVRVGDGTATKDDILIVDDTRKKAVSGEHINFAILINDNDGNGRKGYIEYGTNISGGAVETFRELLLYGDAE